IRRIAPVCPTVFKREGESLKFRANWQLNLDSPIPLSPFLTLKLTTDQSVVDTVGEVNNVALVLRQGATARLTYTPSAVLTAALFVNYNRNELFENNANIRVEQAR